APTAKASSPGSNVNGKDDDFVALRAGDCLGRYEIRSLLGRGGMAEVYKARDSRLGREVAVKVVSRRLARNNDALMRFERETKAIAALSHPNIVAIFDVTQDRDVYFAVMELLEGESLKERLSRGPLPWNETRHIALSVAEGLAAVHATGVVHRDIKPGNIFLTTANVPKLLDFGLARMETNPPAVTSDGSSTITQLTMIGTVLGTADYMSPEQVRGRPADARSDVFSFGAVLYEMITGHRPFQRETPADTMAAILKDPPPPLSETTSAAPPPPGGGATSLADFLHQCLQKNPNERFPTAEVLADALRPLS
ncbi:MAG: serine/threonine-protein kinase, partial [Planctomycetota bacterium]|nr:serine/threonine-protein kinase [Planctomycetota bacterium]